MDPPVGVEGSRRESRAIGIVSSKTFLSKTNFFSQHMFSLPAHVPVEVGGLRPGIKKRPPSLLLLLILHDRLLPRDLSFARSFTCSSDSGMALSSFLPTCQVDTYCAASAPRRAESPPVPFGVDILARSSFASSVSHHKIHKAGLIFELFYKLHRPCPITKSIKQV